MQTGRLQRKPHPDSARSTLISATDRGRRIMNKARSRRIDAIARAMTDLPTTQGIQIERAAPTLIVLAENLRALDT